MTTRDNVAVYQAVAQAVRALQTPDKICLVNELAKEYQETDPRFDPIKFSQACWNEEEW